MTQTYEVRFEKLTYGGEAMGRLPDGRAVFVPFALPDETARIQLTEEKRGFARGKIVEILSPSQLRITSRCKHFTQCGGCHYQNLAYSDQLKAKAEILRDQIQRIGKIENPPVKDTISSPDEWNYRNHVQFHLTKEGKPGYIATDHSTFEVEECHLPLKEIDELRRDLQFDPGADISRVSLRSADDGLTIVLESDSPETPELEIEADVSVAHLFEDHAVTLAGQSFMTIRILEKEFRVSAASFFQVNTSMAKKLVQHLLDHLPADPAATLIDVYCGVGLFSKFVAGKYKKIIGVESSPSACEDFAFNLDEFENIELYEGSAEDVLPGLTGRIETPVYMIVDPPRAGIEKHALDAIVAIQPKTIAYVSCDPSTLARDAARLVAAGYALEEATLFDLFPQTFHIESVCIFKQA